jgi:hypothetical protein
LDSRVSKSFGVDTLYLGRHDGDVRSMVEMM